ncbi:SPOR domain-containing protein [Neisseriaceae bacterium TC5R-5]|nr:SPOR domain-containing protein [Neisseriaceae bacterium TC5R-5]
MALSTQDELILLRKRARRRLVGAIVLVSISTLVLFNVVSRLPEQAMKPESIHIAPLNVPATVPAAEVTATDDTALPPQVQTLPASAPQAKVEPPAVIARPAAGATELKADLSSVLTPEPATVEAVPKLPSKPKPESKPEVKATAKTEIAKPARHADPAAILEGRFDSVEPQPAPVSDGKTVIQLAALSDPQKVNELRTKLTSMGIVARFSKVQTSKGEVTRVRVGPFASRRDAEASLQKLAQAGVNGMIVTP